MESLRYKKLVEGIQLVSIGIHLPIIVLDFPEG